MSYLNDYSAAAARQERRDRLLARMALGLLALLVIVGSLYLWFKNYRQEQAARQFLTLLQREDYPNAYALWGCKVETPCPHYDYKSFQEDWGPSSAAGKVRSFRLGRSRETGSGVIIPVVVNDRPPVKLWVETKTGVLGFAPPLL